MSITVEDIIIEARSWLGTPFHHQGRLKGVGIDCGGLVIKVGNALGLTNFEVSGYARTPSENLMRGYLDTHFDKIDIRDAAPGDVVLFCFDKEPQHVGILTDIGLIHAYAQVRKCVEHSYDEVWKNRARGAYRYRGVV